MCVVSVATGVHAPGDLEKEKSDLALGSFPEDRPLLDGYVRSLKAELSR